MASANIYSDKEVATVVARAAELRSRLWPRCSGDLAQGVRQLAGEKIQSILTRAPGDGNPIGGIKVIAESGWFAARPSGTEDVYKIYAESFRGRDHLKKIQEEAQAMVSAVLSTAV